MDTLLSISFEMESILFRLEEAPLWMPHYAKGGEDLLH